jgi:hypothetical protein
VNLGSEGWSDAKGRGIRPLGGVEEEMKAEDVEAEMTKEAEAGRRKKVKMIIDHPTDADGGGSRGAPDGPPAI